MFSIKKLKTVVAENVVSVIKLNFLLAVILDSYWDCTVDWEIVVHVLLGSIQVYNIRWINCILWFLFHEYLY